MISATNIQLTERERQILKATIEDYIDTMNPVGSNFLKKQHLLPFSPATIRNDLALLEAKGLLTHTHTSSGRVPTELGYRYYVDSLMEHDSNSLADFPDILQVLTKVAGNVDEMMNTVAGLLARISRFFGLVVIGRYQESVLTELELVQLSSDRVMLVLAMKSGLVRSITMNLRISIEPAILDAVTSVLREKLLGLTLREIQLTIQRRLLDSDIAQHEIVQILLTDPVQYFTYSGNALVYQSTITGLLEHPEFRDIDVLHKTITALDSDRIADYLTKIFDDQTKNIYIGSENKAVDLDHCSLVTSGFNSPNLVGRLIVIGPTRIPYPNIISILNKFTEILPDVC